MIDWSLVVRHALWICGAALALAAWSFGRTEGFSPSSRATSAFGALLISVGFALLTPLWQALLWCALGLFAAARAWQFLSWQRHRR